MDIEQKSEKQTNGTIKIWILFAVFICLFIINFFITSDVSSTQRAWIILMLCVAISSIIMLVKNKLPNKKQISISIILGFLVLTSAFGVDSSIRFGMFPIPVVTALSAFAMFSIFNKYPNNAIKLIRKKSIKNIVISILIGIAVGIILGVLNLFLSGEELNLNIRPSIFIVALNPGIYEEVTFRAFIFALCLYLLNDKIETKKQNFTLWFMMIIPHSVVHTPQNIIDFGIISGIINMLMGAILFGLPFALLQRKWDITSSMIAHGVVILIRFSFIGMPI